MSERNHDDDRSERGNKPLETLRDGALKVAIFRNRGENGPFYALDPGRIYTDEKSGEVREVSSLSGSEPLRMAHLLTRGYERMQLHREHDKEQASAKQDRAPRRARARDSERER